MPNRTVKTPLYFRLHGQRANFYRAGKTFMLDSFSAQIKQEVKQEVVSIGDWSSLEVAHTRKSQNLRGAKPPDAFSPCNST